ncbi:5'-AMP-activated protein kinase beta subunit, interation domain-containing protein [Schizophyllum commune]|nr:hypothetical protein K525DRAFT_209887 [Schizophyllum commune Loenen D]KAI5836329.1 hypothetical protein K523DRAFT_410840 [Schizophyllum commune Tattone D]
MGNSPSSPSRPREQRHDRSSTASLSPRPIRHNRRSLELPDLVPSLALQNSFRRRNDIPPKSASIPIPHAAPDDPAQSIRPQNVFSTESIPGSARRSSRSSRGSKTKRGSVRVEEVEVQTIEEVYGSVDELPPPPVPPGSYVPETVLSTIPKGLETRSRVYADTDNDTLMAKKDTPDGTTPSITKVEWKAPAKTVSLLRADDSWEGKVPMHQEGDGFYVELELAPGTHHFRFCVDDQVRVADHIPTTVDDNGQLANYISVLGRSSGDSSPAPTPESIRSPALSPRHAHGYSFFTTTSSTDSTDNIYEQVMHSLGTHKDYHTPVPAPLPPRGRKNREKWTSEIPEELIAAAREEDEYLNAQPHQNANGQHVHIQGFRPAPCVPPAPSMPKHLDRLILNSYPVVVQSPSGSPSRGGGMRERVVDRNTRREIPGMSMVTTDAEDLEQGIPVATASGTNLTAAMKNGHAPRTPTTPALKGGEPRAPALDDSSVLPVPSHAVLHHLSTSSIRNGVLGVGTTTRYRDKYLTTIYYKPT